MTDQTPAAEPLSDYLLGQLRILLDCDVPTIKAESVAALVARLDRAEDALERLHARILRDLPGDASELPPPADQWWARQLDGLVTFAGELALQAEGAPATANTTTEG